MKSHAEILLESRRVEQIGAQYADERRRALADRTGPDLGPRVVMVLPDSVLSRRDESEGESPLDTTLTRHRWIEAIGAGEAIEYRLMEAEVETAPWGEVVRETGPHYVTGSESAYDALEEGYELIEQERLGRLLAPYAELGETGELLGSVDPALIREVELIVGTDEFPAGARIATKAGIVAFLEGRIEASEFIGVAIERSLYRTVDAECVERRVGEQITIGHP